MRVIFVLCLTLPALSGAAPEDKNWEFLFDGKFPVNFRGYKETQFPVGSWSIAYGAIHSVAQSQPVDLVLRERYTNFEFSVQWKATAGASGGIAYLLREGPARAVAGLTYCLGDEAGAPVADPTRAPGALLGLLAPSEVVVKPAGQWNRTRIVVVTNHVEHWLNGKKVLEFNLSDDTFKKARNRPRFHLFLDFTRRHGGHIALIHNRSEMWYRDIKIRRIFPEESPEAPDPTPPSKPEGLEVKVPTSSEQPSGNDGTQKGVGEDPQGRALRAGR